MSKKGVFSVSIFSKSGSSFLQPLTDSVHSWDACTRRGQKFAEQRGVTEPVAALVVEGGGWRVGG